MRPRNSSNGHYSKSNYHQQNNGYYPQHQAQHQHQHTTGHFPSNNKSTTAAASVSTTPSTLKSIDPSLKEKFNFDYLRRKDPKVVKILHTFDHIVLYKVNEAGEWSKESVEGSMFVVERENNELPLMQSYRFVVMNRRSTENYFQEITPALELQLNSPFVLYRDGTTDDIRGLWFYNTLQSLYFVDAVNNIIEKLRTSVTNSYHEGEIHHEAHHLEQHFQQTDMLQGYAPTMSTENVNEAVTNLLKSTLGLSFGNESSGAIESTHSEVPSENQSSVDELEQQLLAQLNTTEPQLGVPEFSYPQPVAQNEESQQEEQEEQPEEQNDVMSFFKQHNINLHVMPSPHEAGAQQQTQTQAAPPPLDILKPQNLLKSLLGNSVCSDEEESEEQGVEDEENQEAQKELSQLLAEANSTQQQLLKVLPAETMVSAVNESAAFDGVHTRDDFKTLLVRMLEDSQNTTLLDSLFEQFQKVRSLQQGASIY